MSDNEKALKMLSIALEMEEKGKQFYAKAVSSCENELAQKIFEQLRDDEDIHIDRIKKIYDNISGDGGWTDAWRRTLPPSRHNWPPRPCPRSSWNASGRCVATTGRRSSACSLSFGRWRKPAARQCAGTVRGA